MTGAAEAVRAQADQLATAWSGPGAPASWALTAALFVTLRDDGELVALAARIDPDRLPALLFVAAVMALVERRRPRALVAALPAADDDAQPPLPAGFAEELRAFCLAHGDELLALAGAHRYQMSEPARCAHLLPAVARVATDAGRPLALIDLGTGAGFALHLDAYRYRYHRGADVVEVGRPDAPVTLDTELRGPRTPALPAAPPVVGARIGVDTEPLDVGAPDVRAWLRACTPPVAEALRRFDQAADYAAAHRVSMVRGDALTVLPDVFARLPAGAHPCLLDAYVHVFFTPEERAAFRAQVAELGRGRDLDWISLDPLVPLGADPRASVHEAELPPGLLARAREEGVFGVLGRLAVRRGETTTELLALGHPGAAWLEWLA